MKRFSKKLIIVFLILLSSIIMISVTVSAVGYDHRNGEASTEKTSDQAEVGQAQNLGGMIFRTIMSLVLVVGILIAVMYGLKWLSGKSHNSTQLAKQMVVHGSLALGPKRSLYVVQVINRILVLGVTDSSITLLTEINDEKEIRDFMQLPKPVASQSYDSFSTQLAGFMKKLKS